MQITRTYDTDMADLAYQISRSLNFGEIREKLTHGLLKDQDAQSELLDLVIDGHLASAFLLAEDQNRGRAGVDAELVLDRRAMHVISPAQAAVGVDQELGHDE